MRFDRKPFLFVGTAKAGTTSIFNYFLGDAYMRYENHAKALEYFNKSLEIDVSFSLACNDAS